MKAEGGMRRALPATPTWDCLGSSVLPMPCLQGQFREHFVSVGEELGLRLWPCMGGLEHPRVL